MNLMWTIFIIVLTIGNIVACWWLLMWTKGISNRDKGIGTTGHVWDEDLTELNHPLPRWWLYLFHGTILFGLLYLLLYPGLGDLPGVLGWTQVQRYEDEMAAAMERQAETYAVYQDMSPEQLMASSDAMDTGRRLFGQHCAMCHGSDGRGAIGFPNLTDDVWQWGAGYDNILTAIKNGRQAMMPPLAAAVGGDDGVLAVSVYVQQLSGQKADTALASRGKPLFEAVCAACHGIDGGGNTALGAPALNDSVWLYGSNAAAIREAIMQGRNGNMPAHDDLISEERQRILAAYVLSLSRQE